MVGMGSILQKLANICGLFNPTWAEAGGSIDSGSGAYVSMMYVWIEREKQLNRFRKTVN